MLSLEPEIELLLYISLNLHLHYELDIFQIPHGFTLILTGYAECAIPLHNWSFYPSNNDRGPLLF